MFHYSNAVCFTILKDIVFGLIYKIHIYTYTNKQDTLILFKSNPLCNNKTAHMKIIIIFFFCIFTINSF